MRWPTKPEREQCIVIRHILRTFCCQSVQRYLSVLGVHTYLNSSSTVLLNKRVSISHFIIADNDITKVCAHLANGKYSHSGPDTHLGHELVRDNTAKDDANTTNNYCHSKQPPSKVIIREVVLVVQITVVCKAQTPCETSSHNESQK
jgi:hypothetical protein